jgi:hypothetical protein
MTFRALLLFLLVADASATPAERRCGWLENPTPANEWLVNREAEWILSVQGGYQAEGMDAMPDNSKDDYGCACLTVEVDRVEKQITHLLSAQRLPLSRCRADHSLPRP